MIPKIGVRFASQLYWLPSRLCAESFITALSNRLTLDHFKGITGCKTLAILSLSKALSILQTVFLRLDEALRVTASLSLLPFRAVKIGEDHP